MFRSLLRSVRQLFASRQTSTPATRSARPRLESLEQRDVPTSLGAELQYLKVAEFQIAMNDVAASYNAVNNFNQSRAQSLLVAADRRLLLSARMVALQYKYGFETRAQALHDLAIINVAVNQVSRDYQTVNTFFTTQGPLSSLLSWNGQYLGNMPNFFTGANMMQ
jgi:hypothetical protein